MPNTSSAKPLHGIPRRSFGREKEEHVRAKAYLDFLAHYDVELVQTDGAITFVRSKTGSHLSLEPKGKMQMLKLLLGEFGTVDKTNEAIQNYKASHS